MAMDKRIYYDGPLGEPTEKHKKETDLMLKILEEKGHVNILDPLNTPDLDDEFIEFLKEDPYALFDSHPDRKR